MIKYLGSKRRLIDEIASKVDENKHNTFIDLFSGTSRVGHKMKQEGYSVIANDYSEYGKVLADTYVVADRNKYLKDVDNLVGYYNASDVSHSKIHGYFTDTFCVKSRFFSIANGRKVDWIREDIEKNVTEPMLKNIMLTSLMEAADRVDSTVGLQMAYLKNPPKRFHKNIELRIPNMVDNVEGNIYLSFKNDSNELVKILKGDVFYIDPPYNQHSYLGNYHIWETLCLWDKPDHYGVACKREDVRERKSDYNSKRRAFTAMSSLVNNLDCKRAIISFNDEGFISRLDMEKMLLPMGNLTIYNVPHKRHVGSKIGIYNKQGVKVGKPSHQMCNEFIYVLDF